MPRKQKTTADLVEELRQRVDVVGVKVFTVDDVTEMMKEMGYEATPVQIHTVLKYPYLRKIESPVEAEWDIIQTAIGDALD